MKTSLKLLAILNFLLYLLMFFLRPAFADDNTINTSTNLSFFGQGSQTISGIDVDFTPARIVFCNECSECSLRLVDDDTIIDYKPYPYSDVMPLYRDGSYTAYMKCDGSWSFSISPIHDGGQISVSGSGSYIGDFFTPPYFSQKVTFQASSNEGRLLNPIVLQLCEIEKDDERVYSEIFIDENTNWESQISRNVTFRTHPNLKKCFWRIICLPDLSWSISTE